MKKAFILFALAFTTTMLNAQAIELKEPQAIKPRKPVWEDLAFYRSGSDTLEIISKKIKYIKIDGEVYEIKRKVEIKKSEPKNSWLNGGFYTPTTPFNTPVIGSPTICQ